MRSAHRGRFTNIPQVICSNNYSASFLIVEACLHKTNLVLNTMHIGFYLYLERIGVRSVESAKKRQALFLFPSLPFPSQYLEMLCPRHIHFVSKERLFIESNGLDFSKQGGFCSLSDPPPHLPTKKVHSFSLFLFLFPLFILSVPIS